MSVRTLLVSGLLPALFLGTSFTSLKAAAADSEDNNQTTIAGMSWHTDYATAISMANRTNKRLFVYFHGPDSDEACSTFEQETLADARVRRALLRMVRVALPLDARVRLGGEETLLVSHDAFAELHRHPGTAVINFALRDPARRGQVDAAGPLARRVVPGLEPRPKPEPEPRPEPQPEPQPRPELRSDAIGVVWFDNYAQATEAAKHRRKMLLIYFRDPNGNRPCRAFEQEALASPEVVGKIGRDYVAVRLGPKCKALLDGRESVLLEQASFAEMLRTPGLAVVDYSHRGARRHGQVVSTFPFLKGKPYTPDEVLVILNLPRGTLTQRTLIYAVRTHPDNPASTLGRLDENLVAEAQSHSSYQARIRLQGHHHWSARFRRINTKLPSNLLVCEVCAESWPGENLVEAAIECVRCWRFSEGHWSAVRAKHAFWGYDMKRGDNRIWYATGLFARQR